MILRCLERLVMVEDSKLSGENAWSEGDDREAW